MFFAPKIPEGWKIAGMFVGTYTGGSSNLTASQRVYHDEEYPSCIKLPVLKRA